MKPVGVGLVGCGAISGEYLTRMKRFPILRVVACADVDPAAAKTKAKEFGIPRVLTPQQLLADGDVELILNLAIPKAHAPLALSALDAGKHTYLEKPLGVSRQEGMDVIAKAKAKKLLVGCAPDTFMGSGIQTARRAIDAGRIGRPVAVTAFMMCAGHETWHPSPEFYYEIGGGPMFDMGPYYVTAMLELLGPVKRLVGLASFARPERTITSKPKFGKVIHAETPDHVTGSVEFENGAVGTIVQSFAAHYGLNGLLTVHGTEGTIQVPNPNHFSGDVRIRLAEEEDWKTIPPVFEHDYGRAVGLADMAEAIRDKRPFRATGEQGLAVLDLMQGFLDSSNQGKHFIPTAPYHRPAPMPIGAPFGVLN
jgi:predicted dehydrogenase